jgi:hypothetical protein
MTDSGSKREDPGSVGARASRDALGRQLYERDGKGTVAWRELDESLRARWHELAEHSLAALADLGYRVEPPDGSAVPDSRDSGPAEAIQQAEKLLRMGEPLLAYNAVQQAIEEGRSDVRLLQLRGLALARSGAVERANEVLAALRAAGHTDGETLGLLARTHKDSAFATTDEARRARHLAAAFEIYASGYRESSRQEKVDDAYYTGINAATLALLRGDTASAREIAREVEELCRRALHGSGADSAAAYWPQATLAEAALLLGDREAARSRYGKAARTAGKRYGDLSSTRRQARMLLEHLGEDSAWLEEVMSIPPVLIYTGHMIDAPGRATPRFPADAEGAVRARIRQRLEQLGPVAAYGSAACGADILCLECMHELGGELHIVLPFPVDDFVHQSVAIHPDGRWRERFERLLDLADEVLVISDQTPSSGVASFEYANLVMTGLARLRADMLETRVEGLAIWDGTDSGGTGGTGSVVELWRRRGVPLGRVTPTTGLNDATGETALAPVASPAPPEADGFEYTIKTMLFADAVGYSRLNDEQIPLFFDHYLGVIAELNAGTPHRAEHVETAGDGMYMVFGDPGTAGHYALALSDLVSGRDWQRVGLPADMATRIGLHCGPVFVGRDPITGRPLYSGSHTSRTARIEPITPPGQVYASSAFAAVATALGVEGLRFSYVGRTQLAKHYGKLALYHVQRP